jgi:PAS domain S-box-containing protein
LGDRTLEGTANPSLSDLYRIFPGDSEMARRMRAFDWSGHELGLPAQWPQSLKIIIRIILTSRQAMFTWWGKNLINLYNDAYISVLGGKHPAALGQPAPAVWHEIWDVIGPRAESALSRDEGTFDEALLLIMERNGFTEETYFTFSYSPVVDEAGEYSGIFSPVTEDTARIIGERQLALLRELSVRTTDARTWQDACTLSIEALRTDPHDICWALIYMIDAERDAIVLAGAGGVTPGSAAAPTFVSLADLPEDLALEGRPPEEWPFTPDTPPWLLRTAARTRRPVLVEDLETLGPAVTAELPVGVHGLPARRAVILPIAPAGTTGKAGFLVVGLSPLRLWDDNYRRFLDLVTGEIAAAIASGHAYAEERRRAEVLSELDRAKTTFFSNVSHEFRTPLALMLGLLDDLLRTELPGDRSHALRDQLEMVHRNALRLLKLVNTLLDFARIEAARMQATYTPTDLPAVTADLASSFRSAIEKTGMRLVVDCPPFPEPVYVDREMWEKIVLNLLSNAFKFTFTGEIAVTLRWCGSHVELAVRDTGVGIPPGELPHVFDRFHRVPNSRGRTIEGTGIGLALVKELVRMHGGAIEAASVPDAGSTFTVSLPAGYAHLAADRISSGRMQAAAGLGALPYVEEALRWLPDAADSPVAPVVPGPLAVGAVATAATGAGDSTASGAALAAARVLVADDNADMRLYLTQLLGARWRVEAVADGYAALAAAIENPPDLILSDVMMPGLDGFELLSRLRADGRLREIPVILLSARAGDEARIEGISAGADDYLVKPFSGRELLARVQAHLELARVRREAAAAQQQLAAALEQQVRRFDAIAGAAEDFIYTFDTEARFTYASKRLLDLWRTTAAEALGKNLWELNYPPAEAARLTAQVKQVVATGRPIRDETIQLGFAAGGAAYEYIFTPIFDAGGAVVAVAGISRDTTERRRFEQQLRESEENLRAFSQTLEARVQERTLELARSNQELDQFAYVASHDLKAPLRAIDHLAAWISQDAASLLPPTSRDHLEKLRGRIKRMEKLLEDLLAYSRAGRHLHEPEWVDTGALARDIGFMLAPPPGFTLEIQSPMPRVYTERVPLETVLRNLIGNAIKHHDHPEAGHVRIAAAIADTAELSPAPGRPSGTSSNTAPGTASDSTPGTSSYSAFGTAPNTAPDAASNVAPNAASDAVPASGSGGASDSTLGAASGSISGSTSGAVSNLVSDSTTGSAPGSTSGAAPGTESGGWVEFTVADNGPGIEPQHHERIFQVFQSLKPRDQVEGSGMGLAVVKKTVENQGGQIEVISQGLGAGAPIRVTWPTRPPSPAH